ncbi:MAG: spermidine synthase [Pseudohongiellaceae bacterium]
MDWLNKLLSENKRTAGDIIYNTCDEHGNILVFDDMAYRVLNFDSPFEQSSMSLSHPYRLTLKYTQLMILVLAYKKPNHITLLGLGGGSLLRTLHHVLPECFFSVFELREKVLTVAKEFFFIPIDERVNIIINDAIVEISYAEKDSTDIIFSDLYSAYEMIPAQTQYKFLKECDRILTDDGWLVMNFHKLPDTGSIFLKKLMRLFPTVIIGSEKGNFILYASKSKPNSITTNTDRVESIEGLIQQNLIPLLFKLKSIDSQLGIA